MATMEDVIRELDRNKPTLLLVTESPKVHSGLANSTREIFTRVHAANKYNIIQLGWSDTTPTEQVPWRVVKTHLVRAPDGRIGLKPDDIWGEKSLPELLKYPVNPDICFSMGDPWMLKAASFGEHRKHYKLVSYITVDGEPAHTRFADVFHAADCVVSPTHYGKDVLNSAGLPCHEVIPYGVDVNVFKAYNYDRRMAIKKKLFDLTPNDILISSVGRNQPRKHHPETIKAIYYIYTGNYVVCSYCKRITLAPFDYVKNLPGEIPKSCKWCTASSVVRGKPKPNVYLYLHCAVNEVEATGWNLKEIAERYFKEEDSRHVFFNERLTPLTGVSKQELCDLYNAMDIFALPTRGEGFGIPILEAMACGTPVVTTNAPAHTEFCAPASKLVECHRMCEHRSNLERYHVVIEDYVRQLLSLCGPNEPRINLGSVGRVEAMKYDWDRITARWIKLFDEMLKNKIKPWQILEMF